MFIFAPRDNMSTTRQDSAPRRNRYSRSSTTSVTQLLSDSCSSLLQRLTTRVRGPSTTAERTDPIPSRKTPVLSRHGSTRSRFEDKYAAILDRYTSYRKRDEDHPQRQERDKSYHRRREESPDLRDEKTLEPSVQRTVVKSPRASVLLSEKAYPYVSTSNIGRDLRREKTPGYHRADRHLVTNSEAYKHYGRHKSGHADSRRTKVRPPNRSGKSEQIEGTSLGLRSRKPGDEEAMSSKGFERKETDRRDFDRHELDRREFYRQDLDRKEFVRKELDRKELDRNKFVRKELDRKELDRLDPEKTPTGNGIQEEEETDPVLREREARRKEIQSLILKYAALDEAYGKFTNDGEKQELSAADKIASKYQKNNLVKNETKIANLSNNDAETLTNAIVSCRTRDLADLAPLHDTVHCFFNPFPKLKCTNKCEI